LRPTEEKQTMFIHFQTSRHKNPLVDFTDHHKTSI